MLNRREMELVEQLRQLQQNWFRPMSTPHDSINRMVKSIRENAKERKDICRVHTFALDLIRPDYCNLSDLEKAKQKLISSLSEH